MKIPPIPTAFLTIGLAATLAMAYPQAGWIAVEGVAFGVAASAVSILSLTTIVSLLTKAQAAPRQGTVLAVLANVFKLPVLLVCLYLGSRLSSVGLYCFLASIGLVYCFTVWLLVERMHRLQTSEKSP